MNMLKRSVMTLFSGPMDAYSHQVRIVLAEKGVVFDIRSIDANHPCEELVDINPYNSLPTLVDRDLVLYNANVIMEYLDERFPHPPLLPVYPVARARSRLMMFRIKHDWYTLIPKMLSQDPHLANAARAEFKEGLVTLAPVFAENDYFLSDEFTLVDCALAPILWRLPQFGIELPPAAQPVINYAERLFDRDSFQVSLSESEREIRELDDF